MNEVKSINELFETSVKTAKVGDMELTLNIDPTNI